MTEYYIRISDEKPLDYDESIYFKLNASNDEDEFYAVRKNSYNDLVTEFNEINTNFSSYVHDIIRDYMNNGNVDAKSVTNPNDSSQKFTYSDIDSIKTKSNTNETNISTLRTDLNTVIQTTINSKIYNSLKPVANNEFETYKTNHSNSVVQHLDLFENDYFVFAKIYWSPSGILAPYKTKQKRNNTDNKYYSYYLTDIFHYQIPERLRPYRDVSVMNSYLNTFGSGKTNSSPTNYSNHAGNLKVTFTSEGKVNLVNLSDYWINKSGTTNGYILKVHCMWAKKGNFTQTNDITTGTFSDENLGGSDD